MSSLPSPQQVLSPILRTLFTETADRLAKETNFIQRVNKLTGASFAQTLVFNRLAPAADGEPLTVPLPIAESSWSERFTPDAVAFCRALLAETVATVIAGTPTTAALLAAFPAVYAIDSTTIALPDAMRDAFPATGGRGSAKDHAALKAHVGIEVITGRLLGPTLTPGRSSDRAAQPDTDAMPVGSLLLRDLAYWSLLQFRRERAQGFHLITRYKPQTKLIAPDGRAQSLADLLTQLPAGTMTFDAWMRVGQQVKLPLRVLARRVSPELKAARIAAAKATVRRKRGAEAVLHPETLALCAWDVVLTSLSAEEATADAVWLLWRVRWQVEQLFKHWKSHGKVETSTARIPERVTCEVLAGLIAMVVKHWTQVTAMQDVDNCLPLEQLRTVRRYVRRIGAALRRGHGLTRVLRELMDALRGAPRRPKRTARPYQAQHYKDSPKPRAAPDPVLGAS